MKDPYKLQRFVDAQALDIDTVKAELANGRKQSHWIWYIFPQIAGLGRSETARYYSISGAGEARAYLAHQILVQHLRDCWQLMLAISGRSAEQVLGGIDAQKLRSSMTLFNAVSTEDLFQQVLDKYYQGEPDAATLHNLQRVNSSNSRGQCT